MSPVSSPASRSRPTMLKHRYDKVRRGKPLTIRVLGVGDSAEEAEQDVKRQIATLRVNVSKYGTRHGVKLVVRIVVNDLVTAKVRVVWDGRRP